MGDVDIAGYGDDITPYSINKNKDLVIHKLEKLSIDFLNGLMVTIWRPTATKVNS